MTIQAAEMTPMLPVSDVSRSAAFYARLFGFAVAHEANGLALLKAEGMSLYLVGDSPPTSDKPGVSISRRTSPAVSPINLTFRVEDLATAHAALVADGVEFLAPPETKPWGEIRVFTRDPDGYLIEIYQPLPRT